jgi:hypothetical protein
MALAVKLVQSSQTQQPAFWQTLSKMWECLIQITPTGNYTAGGDTLDLTQIFNINSSAPGETLPTIELAAAVVIFSQRPQGATGNGFNYDYKFSPGTTLANGTMQVYTATSSAQTGFAEITGAPTAYPANVLNDTIYARCTFFMP